MNKMLSLFLLLIFSFFTLNAHADCQAPLNSVTMALSTEGWVKTENPLVTITIHADVTNPQLATLNQELLEKVKTLDKSSDWHIVAFSRETSSSGLEKVTAEAQARLTSSALSDLKTNVKKLSKPGISYEVESIQFTPTLAEVSAEIANLRATLYKQVQAELDALNKAYPTQSYVIHRINFQTGIEPQAMATIYMGPGTKQMHHANGNMPVSNNMVLKANVEFAATMS